MLFVYLRYKYNMKKQYSLKSKILFNKVLNKGKKINSSYFLISYVDSDDFKLGISVPKKLGNAVFRNKNKRVIKNIIPDIDIYELNKHIVLVVRTKFIDLSYDQKLNIIKEEFNKIK